MQLANLYMLIALFMELKNINPWRQTHHPGVKSTPVGALVGSFRTKYY